MKLTSKTFDNGAAIPSKYTRVGEDISPPLAWSNAPKGSGPHRYFFKIYALDRLLDVAPRDAGKKSLLAAMQGHILDQAELMATFERR